MAREHAGAVRHRAEVESGMARRRLKAGAQPNASPESESTTRLDVLLEHHGRQLLDAVRQVLRHRHVRQREAEARLARRRLEACLTLLPHTGRGVQRRVQQTQQRVDAGVRHGETPDSAHERADAREGPARFCWRMPFRSPARVAPICRRGPGRRARIIKRRSDGPPDTAGTVFSFSVPQILTPSLHSASYPGCAPRPCCALHTAASRPYVGRAAVCCYVRNSCLLLPATDELLQEAAHGESHGGKRLSRVCSAAGLGEACRRARRGCCSEPQQLGAARDSLCAALSRFFGARARAGVYAHAARARIGAASVVGRHKLG